MTKLNHYTQTPASGGSPKQIIVLLHGYGSNGRDLISLAPYWKQSVPDALFVSPDAPFTCEIGGGGFQWFSTIDRDTEKYPERITKAASILDIYLDELLKEYGLTDNQLILGGFSQGSMMSLYVGPRRKGKIAGILGYSGALIDSEGLKDVKNRSPIHLIHGESDAVVSVKAYHHAIEKLTEKGFQVTGHSTPNLDHSIDGKGIESGAKFLSKIVNKIKRL